MDILIFRLGQKVAEYFNQSTDEKVFEYLHQSSSQSVYWNLTHGGFQVVFVGENTELMEPHQKSTAASRVLQLMDEGKEYMEALNTVAQASNTDKFLLETELNYYI